MPPLLYAAGPRGHRQRLRERFRVATADGLHAYEVLELLLTFSIFRRDVKPIAKALLHRFGGLAGVLDADEAELRAVDGVGPATVTLVHLVKQMGTLYLGERMRQRDVLTSPERVAAYAAMKLGGLPHEAFMVVFVNVQNEVLGSEVLHQGTVDQVAVYPRRIIEAALARHAAGVVLVHNHPSGHLAPSDEDKRLTRAIRDAARPLDLRVLDHVIVGGGGSFSFVANGLL
jgi:DNA repair protein RadC